MGVLRDLALTLLTGFYLHSSLGLEATNGLGIVHACMHGSYERWSWAGMDCTGGI